MEYGGPRFSSLEKKSSESERIMCVYSLKRVITTQGLTIGLNFIKKVQRANTLCFSVVSKELLQPMV